MTEQKRIETTILKNLIQNEEFARKTIPFVKSEYFTEPDEKTIFEEVVSYFDKYTNIPTAEALLINLGNNPKIQDQVLKIQNILLKVSNWIPVIHLNNGYWTKPNNGAKTVQFILQLWIQSKY